MNVTEFLLVCCHISSRFSLHLKNIVAIIVNTQFCSLLLCMFPGLLNYLPNYDFSWLYNIKTYFFVHSIYSI